MLRLDPRLAVLWRSPSDLQIGFDPAGPVLRGLSAADERILDVLRGGATSAGRAAALAAAPSADAERLIARLGGALETPPAHVALSVRLRPVDDGAATTGLARRLGLALAAAGAQPAPVGSRNALEVLVGRYAVPPGASSPFLAADAPHLAVVSTDGRMRVGPLVRPGRTACLQCVARSAVDADPALPILLAQTIAGAEPPLTDSAAALLRAASLVAAAAAGEGPAVEAVVAVTEHGETSEVIVARPHPRCGCRVLSATNPKSRPTARRASDVQPL